MSATLPKLGARQPYRLTVEPGQTKTLLLNSEYSAPFTVRFQNQATTGASATVATLLVDDGISKPHGTVAPGEIADVEFTCPVRSITVTQPAGVDGNLVAEALQ